jgi:hypothetical protein
MSNIVKSFAVRNRKPMRGLEAGSKKSEAGRKAKTTAPADRDYYASGWWLLEKH